MTTRKTRKGTRSHPSHNALASLLLALLAAFAPFATLAAGSRDSSAELQTLDVGGEKRRYLLRLPTLPDDPHQRLPLVLVLHGGGGNAYNAEKMTGFTRKGAAEGFIVVYPEGSGRFRQKHLTWNAGHCCGLAMKLDIDDVGFIRVLIDRLVDDYPVDPARIYATGMSNGAMMSHRLGIELGDRLAAIAPVVGTLFGDETKPAVPVSALVINGALDHSVPVEGGPPGGRFTDAWDGTPVAPSRTQAEFWARADGCDDKPAFRDEGEYNLTQYHCPAGLDVEWYLVKDNGHAWPAGERGSRMGDTPSTALDATDVIWEFFRAHRK